MSILYGMIYIAAYCLFLVGASLSYRNSRSRVSLLLMTLAVTATVGIGLLCAHQLEGRAAQSAVFLFGICLGIIAVWIMYPVALLFWSTKRLPLFRRAIVAIEISWFLGTILLTYGYYKVPLV